MENKNILILAAVGIAAFLLLDGSDSIGGGVSGGSGGKKATVETGATYDIPEPYIPQAPVYKPPTYKPPTYPSPSMMANVRSRDTPFGDSKIEFFVPQYISPTNPNMYSSYSAAEAYQLERYLGLTAADPSKGAYDVLPSGFQHATPSKKEMSNAEAMKSGLEEMNRAYYEDSKPSSSSTSSKKQDYSGSGGGSYSNSGFGGWG